MQIAGEEAKEVEMALMLQLADAWELAGEQAQQLEDVRNARLLQEQVS